MPWSVRVSAEGAGSSGSPDLDKEVAQLLQLSREEVRSRWFGVRYFGWFQRLVAWLVGSVYLICYCFFLVCLLDCLLECFWLCLFVCLSAYRFVAWLASLSFSFLLSVVSTSPFAQLGCLSKCVFWVPLEVGKQYQEVQEDGQSGPKRGSQVWRMDGSSFLRVPFFRCSKGNPKDNEGHFGGSPKIRHPHA